MHDGVPMRVLNGVADRGKEAKPPGEREAAGADVVGQWRACLDVLHHEIRLSGSGRAAVDEGHDVGVGQRRENLALDLEAAHEIGAGQERPGDFDGHLLREQSIGPFGVENLAHPAFADALDHRVRAKHGAGPHRPARCRGRRRRQPRGRERPAVPGDRVEAPADRRPGRRSRARVPRPRDRPRARTSPPAARSPGSRRPRVTGVGFGDGMRYFAVALGCPERLRKRGVQGGRASKRRARVRTIRQPLLDERKLEPASASVSCAERSLVLSKTGVDTAMLSRASARAALGSRGA